MKGDACFHCKHQINAHVHTVVENGRERSNGWWYDCALDLPNEHLNGGVKIAMTCPSCDPMEGFQMGGYYTHMWFEDDGGCLEWVIQGNGEFPTELGDETKQLRFHICDFTQIEQFVKFWGKELRKRGWNELGEDND